MSNKPNTPKGDVARQMAAAPILRDKGQDAEPNDSPFPNVFGEPTFAPTQSKGWTSKDGKETGRAIADVHLPMVGAPGLVFRARLNLVTTTEVEAGQTVSYHEFRVSLPTSGGQYQRALLGPDAMIDALLGWISVKGADWHDAQPKIDAIAPVGQPRIVRRRV